MFLVLVAGLVGYAMSGWSGLAIGAVAFAGLGVLSDALTPPGEGETVHERRMRRSRRYRARYGTLEDGWRRDYWPSRSAGLQVPIEIVPVRDAASPTALAVEPVALDEPKPKPKPKAKPKAKAARSSHPASVRASRPSAAT